MGRYKNRPIDNGLVEIRSVKKYPKVTKVGLPATLVRDLETLLDGQRSKFTSAFAVKASL